MKTRTVRQSIWLPAKPSEIFDAILDEKKHSKFTGAQAKILPKVGGKFSVWGRDISGTTEKIEKNKKIVQSWRSSDWEEGHFSEVQFEFIPEKDGTKLVLIHKKVPSEHFKDISDGWKQFYWKPLKEFFKK